MMMWKIMRVTKLMCQDIIRLTNGQILQFYIIYINNNRKKKTVETKNQACLWRIVLFERRGGILCNNCI